ncbi:hypothetical protein V6N13_024946 [Hibiscus sabdariffa]
MHHRLLVFVRTNLPPSLRTFPSFARYVIVNLPALCLKLAPSPYLWHAFIGHRLGLVSLWVSFVNRGCNCRHVSPPCRAPCCCCSSPESKVAVDFWVDTLTTKGKTLVDWAT